MHFTARVFEVQPPTRHVAHVPVGRSHATSLGEDPQEKEGNSRLLLTYANSKLQRLFGNLFCAALHTMEQDSGFIFPIPTMCRRKVGSVAELFEAFIFYFLCF